MLMWLATAVYMGTEVLTFRSAYPDEASRQKLLELSSSTAVRILEGVPGAIDTAGGFAIWDGGWMLGIIVACWALLTATRLTRGEEDSGRAELVLSRPLTPQQALVASLTAMGLGLLGLSASAALPFIVLGEPVAGAVLWGLGLGLLGAVFAALGTLCAQLVEPRRRAVSLGLALAAGAFLLRVVANSNDRRAWVLNTTPFGWLDRLRAFSSDSWLRLGVPVLAVLVLSALAREVRGRRDTASALLRPRTCRRSRLRLLGGAGQFGWRLTSGALTGWLVTLTVSTLVFGLMADAIVDFIKEDDTYRRMLESMGMDVSAPVIGFLSYIAVFTALALAAFSGWRIGAARQEEADGRLDNLLVRGVVRWHWLTVTAALAFAANLVLVAGSAVGLYAGARLVGADVAVSQVVEPMVGTLPLVALFVGLSVLVFAVAPRLTIGLPVTLAVLGYLLDTFGSMLEWPHPVLALSPFHHLARLPGQPMTVTAVVAMTALGLAATAAGIVVFGRRDLQGA
jgi:ABC-2 type transport system permease protein